MMSKDFYVPSASLGKDQSTSQQAAMWLLMKRGLYWRPNAQGYTGLKHEAGRYTDEEVQARTNHDRTETTAIHEDDAPSFAPSCSIDVKYDFVAKENTRLRRGLTFLIRNAEKGEWTLPSSFANWARQLLQRCVSDGDGNREDRDSGLSAEGMPARPTPNPPPSGDIGELVERTDWSTDSLIRECMAQARAQLDPRYSGFMQALATALQSQAAEIERLKAARQETYRALVSTGQSYNEVSVRAESAEARIAELEKERDDTHGCLLELERHLKSEGCTCREDEEGAPYVVNTRAEAAEAHLKDAAKFIRTLGEELVLAGMPGGDREVILANVRAMIARLKDAVKVIEETTGLLEEICEPRKVDMSVSSANIWARSIEAVRRARAFISTTGGDSHA